MVPKRFIGAGAVHGVLLTRLEGVQSHENALGLKEGGLAHLLLGEDGMLLGTDRGRMLHG